MKWFKYSVLMFLFVALLISPLGSVTASQEKFTDLRWSQWAKDSIYYLSDRGTIAGYGNGRFGPSDTITRAQAVTYLVRELYPDAVAGKDLSYQDVPKSHFFYKEIAVATEQGIIGGFSDGTFRPNSPISRAETTAILTRAYDIAKGKNSSDLIDIEKHWARDPIQLLASNNLIGGYTDKTFRPNQAVTRAEFAVFLTRVIQYKRANAIKNEDWDSLLDYMTINEKIGQMLMPDIRMWNGKNTVEMNEGIANSLSDYKLGGLILFNKNITGIEQLTTFTHQLQQKTGDIPLFISIDQEGGVIHRIPNGTNLPGNMALGATQKPELSYQAGKVTAAELHALGINVNFAPVLDINNNPDNPIIGIRSFGGDPQLVSDMGIQFMNGLKAEKVIATAKHFPGHGDTTVDSHLGLPVLDHDLKRLKEVELKPFAAAITNGLDMLMTAHIAFPTIEKTKFTSKKDGSSIFIPATLSEKIITGLLRNEMGYEGIVISDAFTMNAIAEHFGEEKAVQMAISAGVDIILMPNDVAKAFQAVSTAVKNGEISESKLDQSVKRILTVKHNYGLFDQQTNLNEKLENVKHVVGSAQHRTIEKTISEHAITLIKNDSQHLPYKLNNGDHITIIAEQANHANVIKQQLSDMNKNISITAMTIEEFQKNKQIIEKSDFTILATYQFRTNLFDHPWAKIQTVLNELNKQGKGYVNLSLGNPYEFMFLEGVQTSIASYGDNVPNIKASLRVIFGEIEAKGKLPVLLNSK
ncbi:glycoside hydrolase family 3 N-terminal domain-containing protein [Anaerobacillus sp. MEB173]|uniref:glycoside hydrolase family 3 N-terminal domain-containing protein n=1 Tax=Anaerobacillus sp. MEB173 TaxID=3383345 RepID=UPI003F90D003